MSNLKRANLASKAAMLKNVPPILEWDSIKVGDILHRPRFWQLGRKDIQVTSITDETMTYKVFNNGKLVGTESSLSRHSVFARFITRKKNI